MLFTSRTLVEVNATVIAGLLILLSFSFIQPVGTGMMEKSQVISLELDRLAIEQAASEKFLAKICPDEFNFVIKNNPQWKTLDEDFNHDCSRLILEYIINNEKTKSLDERQKQVLEVIPKLMTTEYGVLDATINGMKNFLLIPFIVSVVLEFIINRNFKEETRASGYSLKLSIGGFIMLGFVLTADSILSFYTQTITPLGF